MSYLYTRLFSTRVFRSRAHATFPNFRKRVYPSNHGLPSLIPTPPISQDFFSLSVIADPLLFVTSHDTDQGDGRDGMKTMDKVAQKDGGDGVQNVEVDVLVELDWAGKKRDFHHPFTPYQIQEEFMETVYRVLEGGGGRVGILESPTGTVCLPFSFG
jgi:hypothetical protein